MTDESKAKLLMAYKYAVEADQDGIADLLEDVILDVMGGGTPWMVTRGTQNTLEPPWNVTCTGIDHTTREVTS
jgi:hypothetical protein